MFIIFGLIIVLVIIVGAILISRARDMRYTSLDQFPTTDDWDRMHDRATDSTVHITDPPKLIFNGIHEALPISVVDNIAVQKSVLDSSVN